MGREREDVEGEGVFEVDELINKIRYALPLWVEIFVGEFVYVVEFDKELKKMLAWYEGNEKYGGSEPWDFSNTAIKFKQSRKCIVKRWIELTFINTMRPIYDPSPELLNLVSIFEKTNWYRISGDSKESYGDGGESDLIYPVWANDNLPVPENIRTRTTQLLHELSSERKDLQYNSPVEDIIDPDLCPFLLPQGNWFDRRKKELEIEIQKSKKGESYEAERELKLFLRNYSPHDVTDHIKIRETYCWIPTEFSVAADGKVKINSRIHNLPLRSNKELYKCIHRIFQEMIPGFKKLGIIKEGEETKLQVIIKAQSYNLLPNSTYAGRWHMEGHTEHIAGVGVFYCRVDEELEGGNVKFRPDSCPEPYYAESYKIQTDSEASVKEGAALVFGNYIPHRFRLIRNSTEKLRRRTFVNFFVVDPGYPLVSSRSIPDADFLKLAMISYVRSTLQCTLPLPVAANIIKFIPGMWASIVDAKKFRARAREAMIKEKTGWGWINWGNCGTSEFVPSLATAPPRIRNNLPNELANTDSDKQK